MNKKILISINVVIGVLLIIVLAFGMKSFGRAAVSENNDEIISQNIKETEEIVDEIDNEYAKNELLIANHFIAKKTSDFDLLAIELPEEEEEEEEIEEVEEEPEELEEPTVEEPVVEEPPVDNEPEKKEDKIWTEEVTETEEIPFETLELEDKDLAKGKRRIEDGEKGEKIVTYLVTYKNGKVISKVKESEEVEKKSIMKIIYIGTKEGEVGDGVQVPGDE